MSSKKRTTKAAKPQEPAKPTPEPPPASAGIPLSRVVFRAPIELEGIAISASWALSENPGRRAGRGVCTVLEERGDDIVMIAILPPRGAGREPIIRWAVVPLHNVSFRLPLQMPAELKAYALAQTEVPG